MDSQSPFQESFLREVANAQGDNSWAHIPTPLFRPAPSQDRLFQLNAATLNRASVLEFGILQPAIQMQDANPVHVPSLFVTPALSQSHYFQPNASTHVQPRVLGLSTWPQMAQIRGAHGACLSSQFLAPESSQDQVCQLNVPMHLQPPVQELGIRNHTTHAQDPSPFHIPPHLAIPILSQDGVAQLNAPTFQQPPACESSIGQQTVQVPDSSGVHFPFQFVMPASPQNQLGQLDAPISPQPLVCPECNTVQFHHRRERDRHIRSHFAHSLFCPFPRCPWRGNRQDVFKAHWKRNHENYGQAPVQPENVIYNPGPLVKLVDWNALTVESALEISLSIVRIRARELNRIGVWEGGWGRRAKFGQ